MRFLLFLIILPFVLISGNRDSLANLHYKVRFLLQNKISHSKFQYVTDQGYYNYFHGGEYGHSENYSENIISQNIWNPELKIDFELPCWFKITCGANYNSLKFESGYGEIINTYVSYIVAPNSTPYNPIIIGQNETQSKDGYFKEKVEISMPSTFFGFGIAKQYRKFNFDMDYTFSAYKGLSGIRTKSYYDINYGFLSSDKPKIMEYGGGLDRLVFSSNISTNICYRVYKHINLKLGYNYSSYITRLYYDSADYDSSIKNIKTHGFIIGICFSII